MTAFLQTIFGDFHGHMLAVLISASQWTIYLSLTAFTGGGLIGLVMAVARLSPSQAVRRLATGYIWLFQSIPLLMLLFLIGLGVRAFFLVNMPPWVAATAALTLFTSAYMAEVWRGALESVPAGQWEGGFALGLTFRQVLVSIIAPQALRIATPPTVGFMVQVIKGTSMAYIIDYNDLIGWERKLPVPSLKVPSPSLSIPSWRCSTSPCVFHCPTGQRRWNEILQRSLATTRCNMKEDTQCPEQSKGGLAVLSRQL